MCRNRQIIGLSLTAGRCYALAIPQGAGAGAAWRHMRPPLCLYRKKGNGMNPSEIRQEIKRILGTFTEEQVEQILQLVELTMEYNRIMGIE